MWVAGNPVLELRWLRGTGSGHLNQALATWCGDILGSDFTARPNTHTRVHIHVALLLRSCDPCPTFGSWGVFQQRRGPPGEPSCPKYHQVEGRQPTCCRGEELPWELGSAGGLGAQGAEMAGVLAVEGPRKRQLPPGPWGRCQRRGLGCKSLVLCLRTWGDICRVSKTQ